MSNSRAKGLNYLTTSGSPFGMVTKLRDRRSTVRIAAGKIYSFTTHLRSALIARGCYFRPQGLHMFQQRMPLLGHYVYSTSNTAWMLQSPPRGCKTLRNGGGARVFQWSAKLIRAVVQLPVKPPMPGRSEVRNRTKKQPIGPIALLLSVGLTILPT
jgi:hypothetical protein